MARGARGMPAGRDARLYIAGQLISVFGDTTLWLGLGIWVKAVTGSSSAAGLVFFVYALPYLAAPLAGLLVDRVRRRPLLISVNLLSVLVVLPLLAVTDRDRLWVVYAVVALYGVSGSLISSAQSAFLTVLVARDQLPAANAVLQTGREALRLISPLLGAGAVAAVGNVRPLVVVDAATFLVAAGTLAALRVRESRPVAPEAWWGHELAAGVSHLWRTIPLRQIVVATGVALLVVGFAESVIFSVVQEGLHRPATFVGVLVSLQGVGAIAGGATAAAAVRRIGDGRTLGAGLCLFAIGDLLLMGTALPVVVPGIVVAGFGLPWVVVGLMVAIQQRTPAHLQGRAAAAADALVTAPQTLSIGVGAALILTVDYRVLLAVMGATVIAAGGWLASRPEQRSGRAMQLEETLPALPSTDPPPLSEGISRDVP